MNQDQILQLLKELGNALSAGDLRSASSCWDIPALVLSDDGAMVVASRDEVQAIFAAVAKWYHEQGLTSTKPESNEWIFSAKLSLQWMCVGRHSMPLETKSRASGLTISYTPHIRVALTRTK